MATVLRVDGFRVAICPNDHRPAHVHAIKAEKETVFNLHCPNGPPELRENYGFSRPELRRIKAVLAAELNKLCEQWKAIHGAT